MVGRASRLTLRGSEGGEKTEEQVEQAKFKLHSVFPAVRLLVAWCLLVYTLSSHVPKLPFTPCAHFELFLLIIWVLRVNSSFRGSERCRKLRTQAMLCTLEEQREATGVLMANEITNLGEKLFLPSLYLNKDHLLIFTYKVLSEPHNNAKRQSIYISLSIL